MGELPQFYEGMSGKCSAKYHCFCVIKKWIKKDGGLCSPPSFLLLGHAYGRVYVLTSPPKSSIESIKNWMTYFGL